MPDMIFFKDLDSKYIRVSDSLAEFFGRSVEQILGKNDADLLPLGETEEIQKIENEILGKKQGFLDHITELDSEKGKRYLSTTKIPNINKNGKVVGIIDITRNLYQDYLVNVWKLALYSGCRREEIQELKVEAIRLSPCSK